MDCKAARLLLEFYRPGSIDLGVAELGPEEILALEEHLAACLECDSAARAEKQVDEAIARTMRRVDVPDRLRARILGRLAADSGIHQRRRYGRLVRYAVAAALLLCSLIGYAWTHRPYALTTDDLEAYWMSVKADKFSPPDADALRDRFKTLGVDAAPPQNWRYKFLTAYGVGDFKGKPVPQMVFVRDDNPVPDQAQVLILSERQFNVAKLPAKWQSEEGYAYQVEAKKDPDSQQVFLIFHTGDNFDWLEPREEEKPL